MAGRDSIQRAIDNRLRQVERKIARIARKAHRQPGGADPATLRALASLSQAAAVVAARDRSPWPPRASPPAA